MFARQRVFAAFLMCSSSGTECLDIVDFVCTDNRDSSSAIIASFLLRVFDLPP